jgi:hypothetical protein
MEYSDKDTVEVSECGGGGLASCNVESQTTTKKIHWRRADEKSVSGSILIGFGSWVVSANTGSNEHRYHTRVVEESG